jgi:prepilin peptidase CpaA
LPAIAIGLIIYIVTKGYDGFLFSGKGLIVGFALLLIPFMMGGIGAGDVKLLAAVGALKGALFAFYAFLFGAMIGGVIALVMMLRKKEMKNFFTRIYYSVLLINTENGSLNLSKDDIAPTIPYGVVIALGALCSYLLEGRI